MRQIDLKTWPRRDHFNFFSAFDYPHGGMCTNVDLTTFHPYVKQCDIPFTVATVYVLARAANDIPEFRYRIRSGEVVEHEIVHPSITVLASEDLFGFCPIDYDEDFFTFCAIATERIASAKECPSLEDIPGKDDLLFMTAVPWVSFTGLMHPIHMHPVDSVPRIAWGKFFEDGERLKMPLSVQAHHGLVDGIHMGRFFVKVQEFLDNPDCLLGDP